MQRRDSDVNFLSASTAFVNIVLVGQFPSAVAPFFFGGRFLALNKKDGGVRPIDIGMTPHQFVTKYTAMIGSIQLSDWLRPHQLGSVHQVDVRRQFMLPVAIWRQCVLTVLSPS
jgi:hypothetical protein